MADILYYYHKQDTTARPSAQKCYQILWKDSANTTIQANYFAGTTADSYYYPGTTQWGTAPSPGGQSCKRASLQRPGQWRGVRLERAALMSCKTCSATCAANHPRRCGAVELVCLAATGCKLLMHASCAVQCHGLCWLPQPPTVPRHVSSLGAAVVQPPMSFRKQNKFLAPIKSKSQ
jgi:hypothetical protein